MRARCWGLLFCLCLPVSLTTLLFGSAGRGPLSPKEATKAMMKLRPYEKGFLTKLKALVKAGADISAENNRKMTMLHKVALLGGSSDAARFIVDNIDDIPFYADFRDSPLWLSIYSDNVGVAEALMEKGHVNPNLLDKHGMTMLLYALEYESNRVAKSLIHKGASVDALNTRGQSPLHLVADKKTAELILEKGGDPNARDNTGMTPLHYAADYNNLAVADLLAKASDNVNAKGGRDNNTPLHFSKSAEMAEILLKHGGDPNAQTSQGRTPLHGVNNLKLVRVLILHGGNPNARDKSGRTPLDYATTKEFVKSLLLFGAEHKKSYAWRFSNSSKQSGKKDKPHPTKFMYQLDGEEEQASSQEEKGVQPDFLTNLNELARQKNNNPLIGREAELTQVVNALRRKGMKGTVLVGDPGVGKTAIIEGLSYLLANDALPELAGREIYSLNVGSMWGDKESKYVGQLQRRFNEALEFIAAAPDKRILFIDEIHQLLGGGQISTSSSPPITDLFKPFLGRGDIMLIGATTHDEHQDIIEGDRAIVDRLLRIDIDEPSHEETLAILRGIKPEYEEHYGIAISDTALQAAVKLTNRYLAAQQQPRKAITLLDEATAALPHGSKRLTKKHVATIIADKIGIEVATILQSENEKMMGLMPALQARIFGQPHAIEEVNMALAIASADLGNETRPRAVMLFAGKTGVGKTEMGKAIAQHLFDSEDNFISVDMSGYKHPTSVMALTEKLTRAVKAKPYAVILLDELEKANEEVQHLLLQLLDEGRLTDSRQRKVDFTNTIIVLTTNSKDIENDFAPELRNRFNRIIHFRKLNPDISLRLVQKELDELNGRLREKKITLTLSEAAQQIIADIGYNSEDGARAMARVFERLVTFPLSEIINSGKMRSGKDYHLDLQRTGNTRVKASLRVDDEVVLEVPISVKDEGQKNDNPRGII